MVKIKFEPRAKEAINWVYLTIERLVLVLPRVPIIGSQPTESIALRNNQWNKATNLCQFNRPKTKKQDVYSNMNFQLFM